MRVDQAAAAAARPGLLPGLVVTTGTCAWAVAGSGRADRGGEGVGVEAIGVHHQVSYPTSFWSGHTCSHVHWQSTPSSVAVCYPYLLALVEPRAPALHAPPSPAAASAPFEPYPTPYACHVDVYLLSCTEGGGGGGGCGAAMHVQRLWLPSTRQPSSLCLKRDVPATGGEASGEASREALGGGHLPSRGVVVCDGAWCFVGYPAGGHDGHPGRARVMSMRMTTLEQQLATLQLRTLRAHTGASVHGHTSAAASLSAGDTTRAAGTHTHADTDADTVTRMRVAERLMDAEQVLVPPHASGAGVMPQQAARRRMRLHQR